MRGPLCLWAANTGPELYIIFLELYIKSSRTIYKISRTIYKIPGTTCKTPRANIYIYNVQNYIKQCRTICDFALFVDDSHVTEGYTFKSTKGPEMQTFLCEFILNMATLKLIMVLTAVYPMIQRYSEQMQIMYILHMVCS